MKQFNILKGRRKYFRGRKYENEIYLNYSMILSNKWKTIKKFYRSFCYPSEKEKMVLFMKDV